MAETGSSSLKHVERDGVVQYLGVQYASLEHKFADAKIREYSNIDTIKATTHGPSPISPPNACEYEFGLIQQSLPLGELPQSDTECLNLNITAPAGLQKGQSKLPVFVFIHGGGYSIGSSAWPQADQARIVKLSKDTGMPVIGVSINYRLGPFGFMTSNELRSHGYSANNGLTDQRTALLWIQKYIELFGGDPNRVTCIGESAGAVSTMHQIQLAAGSPPFQQFFSMSGSPLMMKPLPNFVAEGIYQTVINILGFEKLSVTDRMAALSKISASELFSKLPAGLPFLPVLDECVLKHDISFSGLQSDSGVDPSRQLNMLIGSCDMDASIFGIMFGSKKSGCLGRFTAILNEAAPQHASEVLKSYSISNDMSDDDAWPLILNFANDIGFHAPARAYATAWPSSAYLYRFREPNPWDGPWKGYSTHVLDVAYLFLNYTERLTPSQKDLAVQFATDVVSFVNGNPPFQAVKQDSRFVKEYTSVPAGDDSGKEIDTVWPELFSSAGYDTLSAVWASFLGS